MNDEARNEKIEVSREAIAALAAQAASGVEGVAACQLKAAESLTSRVKREFVHKGVKVDKGDDSYALSIYLRVRHGVNIPSLVREVIKKVREYVEGLTQVEVSDIEVVIEDIDIPAT